MKSPLAAYLSVRSAIRKNSRYNIFLSILLLNLLGISMNIIYFRISIPDYLFGRGLLYALGTLAWALPLGFYLYQRRERPITEALRLIKSGAVIQENDLVLAQRQMKTRARFTAILNFALWFLTGLEIGITTYLFGFLQAPDSLHLFAAISFLTNPIISVLVYFLTEILSRNDMRVLEIDIDLDSMGFRIQNKVLFTMIFLSSLFIIVLSALHLISVSRSGRALTLEDAGVPLVVTAIAGVYIVSAALMVSRSITTPLKELLVEMKKVENGILETRVHITSTDEVAVLARGFNGMVEGLRERERIRDVFGKYVSSEIRDQILKGEVELGGKEESATILFCDIRNFTTLSEEHSPAEIVEMLNQYFTEMVRAIRTHGGVVDKFIGDAVMAIFGAFGDVKNHASSALAAAEEMLRRLEAHNFLQQTRGEPIFEIGIGIHTGPVILGNIGSEDRREFTAIGDTVNTASRIESQTKTFGRSILFSKETHELSGRGVFAGEAALKGKAGSTLLYSL